MTVRQNGRESDKFQCCYLVRFLSHCHTAALSPVLAHCHGQDSENATVRQNGRDSDIEIMSHCRPFCHTVALSRPFWCIVVDEIGTVRNVQYQPPKRNVVSTIVSKRNFI